MGKNVEFLSQKWPPASHFESDIIGNIEIGFPIPPNPIFGAETNTLIYNSLGNMGKNIEYLI